MSNTDPQRGSHDLSTAMAPSQPGSPASDNHGTPGSPTDAVIRRGYEEDEYDTRSVLSVPILVIVFFVLAFTSVTILFSFFRHTPDDPMANPQIVEDNSRPLPDRIASTPSRGRPEPLFVPRKGGENARAITGRPAATGNSPEYHPEDIRPSLENTPTLFESGWVVPGKVATVPLNDAKALALRSGTLKARPGASPPLPSWKVPSGANAGQGFGESVAMPPSVNSPAKEGKH
ncbi:MAG TPA: hypothetical protein VLM40_10485 [Gemmata sp.]|nr:hypothetical protein [Gemmata sp.]